jgi:nucleoside-diphosphate-sugar epimerase
MRNVLVTGANGFVGKRFLTYNNHNFIIQTISLRNNDWQQQDFSHIDAVVHLAGKAHEMQKIDDQIYYDVNVQLTQNLFEKLTKDGVKHFVYISSTKVYGDDIQTVLNENSTCTPTDAYGKSKLAAEQFLLAQKNCTISIVRPPLIYGAGVKGNMHKIMELCNSNKPLPFAAIDNKRSMVYVDNLVELINTIITKKEKGIFVAGDATPLSTTELVTYMRKALGKKRNLFSIPLFMRAILKKIKPALYIRLFGSFYVNNEATNRQLQFQPTYTAEHGIQQMVNDFLKNK